MDKLLEIIKVDFRKVTQENYDNVLIITGREGSGKSTLALWILHYWLFNLYGKVTKEDSRFITLDKDEFKRALGILKRFEPLVFDEASIYSNKNFMTRANKEINYVYTVIRANNNFSIMVLPNFFDLDSYFKKFRTRGLIYVWGRKYFRFYNPDGIIKLLKEYKKTENPYSPFKRKRFAWFTETYPDYNGELLEGYIEKKNQKIDSIKAELNKWKDEENEQK